MNSRNTLRGWLLKYLRSGSKNAKRIYTFENCVSLRNRLWKPCERTELYIQKIDSTAFIRWVYVTVFVSWFVQAQNDPCRWLFCFLFTFELINFVLTKHLIFIYICIFIVFHDIVQINCLSIVYSIFHSLAHQHNYTWNGRVKRSYQYKPIYSCCGSDANCLLFLPMIMRQHDV